MAKNLKANIGENAKICVKWNVLPIDYTDEKAKVIISKFAKKYNVPKEHIVINPQMITKDTNGNFVEYSSDMANNIQDIAFQQNLFKEYIAEREIKDCDFDKIVAIDNEINNKINYDLYEQQKRYNIKWIKWSNFMSYGPDNFFDFTTLSGLVLLSSDPANQGGKTTFCLDLLRFLLFGKVTSRESDWTLAKVFNKHLPEATEVSVEGCIEIDGIDYVIKRVVTRPALAKRTEKSKVSQKIEYYKLINGDYVDLVDEDSLEDQAEDNGRETNKRIKEALGNERDFDLMICVDSDNLKGLISLKDTERGRLLARWVGLLPLEDKDKVAREMFNKGVLPMLILNKYNKEDLLGEIETLEEANKEYANELTSSEKDVEDNTKALQDKTNTKETLLSSKREIDQNLIKVDVPTLQSTINSIIEKGKLAKEELKKFQSDYAEIGEVNFSKNTYDDLLQKKIDLNNKLTEARSGYKLIQEQIKALEKGEFCPTCGARLKDVDNSKEIKNKKEQLEKTKNDGVEYSKQLEETDKTLKDMDLARDLYEKKTRLSLLVEKKQLEIENLTASYKENKRLLDDIEKNKEAIENNNRIDTSINIVVAEINAINNRIKDLNNTIQGLKLNTKSNEEKIKDNKAKIVKIEEEEVLVRNWKVYLEMIGKNGISKMVLRKTLPLINGELKHLLSEVCDFDVEVVIDDHNDVAFYLIHDEVKSNLASGSGFEQTVASLALRSVLSKISTFSKPSFVVFDEILGGVAESNYDTVKLLYDKIAESYAFVFQITHNQAVRDWHKSEIVVTKKNNISKIKTF